MGRGLPGIRVGLHSRGRFPGTARVVHPLLLTTHRRARASPHRRTSRPAARARQPCPYGRGSPKDCGRSAGALKHQRDARPVFARHPGTATGSRREGSRIDLRGPVAPDCYPNCYPRVREWVPPHATKPRRTAKKPNDYREHATGYNRVQWAVLAWTVSGAGRRQRSPASA